MAVENFGEWGTVIIGCQYVHNRRHKKLRAMPVVQWTGVGVLGGFYKILARKRIQECFIQGMKNVWNFIMKLSYDQALVLSRWEATLKQ